MKPRVERSNIKTFSKNLKNYRRPMIYRIEQHLQNYAPHQKITKGSYAKIVNSNKKKVCIIGDSHLNRINERKLKACVRYFLSYFHFSPNNSPLKTPKNAFYSSKNIFWFSTYSFCVFQSSPLFLPVGHYFRG